MNGPIEILAAGCVLGLVATAAAARYRRMRNYWRDRAGDSEQAFQAETAESDYQRQRANRLQAELDEIRAKRSAIGRIGRAAQLAQIAKRKAETTRVLQAERAA